MRQKEINTSYFGALVLMALLFLFAASFPGKVDHSGTVSSKTPASIEMSSVASKAIAAEAVVLPSAQKSCLTLVYRPVYSLFSKTLKLAVDNNRICQQLTLLEQESDQIKPLLFEKWLWFAHLHVSVSDPFVLS
jgi:hypothetical protein